MMGKIKHENYLLIKEFMLIVFGAFIGSLFGLISQGQLILEALLCLTMVYGLVILFIILFVRGLSEKN